LVRVIFTGTTGVRKLDAIGQVIDEVLSSAGKPPDHNNVDSLRFIRYFDFEQELSKLFDVPLWTYLMGVHEKTQREMWDKTFNSIMKTIAKEKPKHVFIGLHATFFQSSRFFSVLNQDKIRRFKPDLFVTLIDDTYAVWKRIVTKSESGVDRGKSYLRLRDILSWRAVELLVTDLIANRLQKRNFMVAVKHPARMLFDLVFNPRKLFVYASYPISKTRNDKKIREEIDKFRYKLHEDYVVFDPLTIDEKIMGLAAEGQSGKRVDLRKESRWPLPGGWSMVYDDDLTFPLSLIKGEISEVERDIEDYIEARDYRLVSQADALIAYRPYYGGEFHRGVNSEIHFATNAMKERYFYTPNEDDKKKKSPFKDKGRTFDNLNEMYDTLTGVNPTDRRTWGSL